MRIKISFIIMIVSIIIVFFTQKKNYTKEFIESEIYEKYKYETSLDREPIQKSTEKETFEFKGTTIKPKKEYAIKARVLSKEKYYFDMASKISNYDLALGWKSMAKEDNIKKIKISQSGRWYRWRVDNFFISRNEISHNSANVHIVHANEKIKEIINSTNEGDEIALYGYLINVDIESLGWRWRTSTSRKDTGDGACEIIFVEHAEIIK